MNSNPAPSSRGSSRGSAMVAVLMVVVIFLALVMVLLELGRYEAVMSVNEQDHLQTIASVESGIAWAQKRIDDASQVAGFTDFSSLLAGPSSTTSTDDFLLGLRDLSLTSTSQLNDSNTGTKSAIVQRDFFGNGNQTYEAFRVPGSTPNTRALVYVRMDDNFDDDAADPTNDDPLTDTDQTLQVTAVAEFPVFVDAAGVEVPNRFVERGRAQRAVRTTFGPRSFLFPAIATNGKLEIGGNPTACGDCGSVHSNTDLDLDGGPVLCEDATSSGAWSSNGNEVIGGQWGGGFPIVPIPPINPYDDLYVPDPDVFDTTALSLPAELQCGAPTAADPGNAKYFAFVANNKKGLVYKAYWDFSNDRWTWRLIDDLDDNVDVQLDECGRAPGDPFYGAAVSESDPTLPGKRQQFYGFKQVGKEKVLSCELCSSADADDSLCDLANNDYTFAGYYDADSGAPRGQSATSQITSFPQSGVPGLPGSYTTDGVFDYDPENDIEGGTWSISTGDVFAPLMNAVIFVYGHVSVSANIGVNSGSYCNAAGCGANGSVPNDVWNVSFISYGDIDVSSSPSYGPANEDADYHFLLVAGRDIDISGSVGATAACPSLCSSTAPAGVEIYAGILASHEQFNFTGSPQIHGFVVVEDAIDCSQTVNGHNVGLTKITGNPSIFYDCQHPPNPWANADIEILTWQEIE